MIRTEESHETEVGTRGAGPETHLTGGRVVGASPCPVGSGANGGGSVSEWSDVEGPPVALWRTAVGKDTMSLLSGEDESFSRQWASSGCPAAGRESSWYEMLNHQERYFLSESFCCPHLLT